MSRHSGKYGRGQMKETRLEKKMEAAKRNQALMTECFSSKRHRDGRTDHCSCT